MLLLLIIIAIAIIMIIPGKRKYDPPEPPIYDDKFSTVKPRTQKSNFIHVFFNNIKKGR